MTYRVDILPSARRELAALPLKDRTRVDKRILSLGENPRPVGSKKLTDEDDLYRLRIGDYRVIYQVQDKVLLVLVVKIGNRREVYRKR